MGFIKLLFRLLLKSIFFLFIVVFSYLCIAIILALIPVNSNFEQTENGINIFINTNGIHTNIILPTKTDRFNWTQMLNINENCKYIAFGWGDRDFYLNTPSWSYLKFNTALKAALLPTKAIIQVYCIDIKPVPEKNFINLKLNEEQFAKLSKYVFNSFIKNEKEQFIPIKPSENYIFKEKFFEAKGRYSIFFTCNNWVGKGLKQAGIKNSLWSPFDKSVFFYLKRTSK